MPSALKYMAPRKNKRPWGYREAGGASRGILRMPPNPINHYFDYQVGILRGRFTPVGFLLEKVFRFFDFFVLFDFLNESCANLGLNML